MTTQTKPKPQSAQPGAKLPPRRLFTIDEYDRMIEAGIICDGERVELVGGEIFQMASMGIKHVTCIIDLQDRFLAHGLPLHRIRGQFPVRLPPRSEPEPDLSIVRDRADRYRTQHPNPEDILLAIEVSDSTLRFDRDVKLPHYAAAGIPETWIWDLRRKQVLVCRDPKDGQYTSVTTVSRDGTLSPLAFSELKIIIDEVLR